MTPTPPSSPHKRFADLWMFFGPRTPPPAELLFSLSKALDMDLRRISRWRSDRSDKPERGKATDLEGWCLDGLTESIGFDLRSGERHLEGAVSGVKVSELYRGLEVCLIFDPDMADPILPLIVPLLEKYDVAEAALSHVELCGYPIEPPNQFITVGLDPMIFDQLLVGTNASLVWLGHRLAGGAFRSAWQEPDPAAMTSIWPTTEKVAAHIRYKLVKDQGAGRRLNGNRRFREARCRCRRGDRCRARGKRTPAAGLIPRLRTPTVRQAWPILEGEPAGHLLVV